MKRKMMFLMLTFFVLSAASVKSQVTIGSDQEPQGGAVLDLSKVSDQDLGFLLPRVWLTNVNEWQLRGDESSGIGMLIYNINPNTTGGNGKAGLYIWTGTDGWEPLKSNLSDAVQVDGFDLIPSGSVDIYVGETVSFTAFNFMPLNAAYPGVIWTIPEGTDYAYINTESKTMTGCFVTGISVGTATLMVTSLDNNVRESVAVNVKVCTSAPAAPTGITFSKTTGIKLNETITATATPEVTSGGAKPAKYNWTIPGDYFDIVSGTNDRVITLKAKAAVPSITNTIKVNAENDCGKSADYSNTTALLIVDCVTAPADPTGIIFSKTTNIQLNEEITATATPEVTSGNTQPTKYNWTVPGDYFDITSGTNDRVITLKAKAPATSITNTIKVNAENDCGKSADYSNTTALSILDCSALPVTPTGITFSKTTGIKLNEEITATATPEVTSGNTQPTKYNWTIPGDYFDITSGTNNRVVTLKAKAAVSSITNTIKVNAENNCGKSADYSNTTALNIVDCATAPDTPGSITIPISVIAGENFTASISAVSGATSYTWNVPSGLTIVEGQNTIEVTYKAISAGTIAAGAITVTANNDCGPSAAQSTASAMKVVPACSGYIIANGEYSGPSTTTALSTGDNFSTILSKGFSATGKSLCLAPSDQGSPTMYTWASGASQCASLTTDGASWRMPNIAELANLQSTRTSYNMRQNNYGCSTERDGSNAWYWRFNLGSTTYGGKQFSAYVRCVRSL